MIQPIFGGMNSHEELCFALITYVNQNRDEPLSGVGWAGEQDKHDKLQHSFDCNNTLWWPASSISKFTPKQFSVQYLKAQTTITV